MDEFNEAPDIHSARYAGEYGTDDENNHKLLLEMHDTSMDQWRAGYVCCLVLLQSSINTVVSHSTYLLSQGDYFRLSKREIQLWV